MKRRLSRGRLLGVVCALGASAQLATTRSAKAAEAYTMRMSMPQGLESALGMSSAHFATAVERRSNGQLKVELYPNGQLAKEKEAIDGVGTGVVDFTISSSSFLIPLFPRFEVLGAPFLFSNGNVAFRLLDGAIGNDLFSDLDAKGIVGLGWGGGSFKQFQTTTKAISVPEDLKGLRIRSIGGAVYNAIFQALGSIPITIDIAETYTALSQHTVDGLDSPLDSFTFQKLYNVAKHIAMTNHIFNVNPFIVSKRKLEALPGPLQRIIREEGKGLPTFWRALLAKQTTSDIQFLKNNGCTFTETQYPAFRKAMEPVYALLQSRPSGETLERIRRAAGA